MSLLLINDPENIVAVVLTKVSIFTFLLSLLLPINSYACEAQVGRKIIDQLMNNQLKHAQRLLSHQIKRAPLDPMNGFFEGAIQWAFSGEGQNKKLAQQALSTLENSVRHSQQQLQTNPENPKHLLNSGMSQMLVARAYAGRKQWIAAYKNGKQARLKLQKLVRDHPDEKDGLIGIGLFEFYTGSVPPGLRWLSKLVNFSGNRNKGIQLIHQAVKESPMFAPEAGRMVVNEIIYSGSDNLCQYLDLTQTLRSRYPNNPQFSFAYQKVFNNCGYSQKALNDNHRAQKQFSKYRKTVNRFKALKLYMLSNLGKIKELNTSKTTTLRARYHKYIAQGMFYDTRSQRKKAVAFYQKAQSLAVNNQGQNKRLNKNIPYLKKPYKQPTPHAIAKRYPIASGCS